MNGEITKNSVTSSISAVKQYIALRQENRNRHPANILVHANEKDCCPSVCVVSAKVSENTAEIIIEDFQTIYGDRSNRFTIEDTLFSFICATLKIRSTDIFGRPITVEITGV